MFYKYFRFIELSFYFYFIFIRSANSNSATSATVSSMTSMSSITKEFTRELRDLSSGGAAGLIQNFQSLLKEGDLSMSVPKFSKDEVVRICT